MNFIKCVYLLLSSHLVLQSVTLADNAVETADEIEQIDDGHREDIERLSKMEGHMRPFGSVGRYFDLYAMEGFPTSPREFFNKYVILSTPLLMKNAAKISPAFTKWTDEYFIKHPGSAKEQVFVEGRKKENRSGPGWMMNFKRFVKSYDKRNLYMVNELPSHLKSDVIIPPPIQCEPIIAKMMDVVTWFSSGGTRSVLHNDGVDNINCLYRGNKTLIFLNPHDTDNIWNNVIDIKNSGYSSMDVDAVDFTKFPDMANVRYAKIDMVPGDCLYIPYRWFHQVNSFGSNLAVNLWWRHDTSAFFDLTDDICGDFTGRNTIANISYPGMEYYEAEDSEEQTAEEYKRPEPTDATNVDTEKTEQATESHAEPQSNSLASKLYRVIIKIRKPVDITKLKEIALKKIRTATEDWDVGCQDVMIRNFALLDQNHDAVLTSEDVDLFYAQDKYTRARLKEAIALFPLDLRSALRVATAKKDREYLQKLLDRGEVDMKQITKIFGSKFAPNSSEQIKEEL